MYILTKSWLIIGQGGFQVHLACVVYSVNALFLAKPWSSIIDTYQEKTSALCKKYLLSCRVLNVLVSHIFSIFAKLFLSIAENYIN
jgi:hypothetical protein